MKYKALFLFILVFTANVAAQTTEFTYQGQLQSSSVPGNGSFDFEFALFDAAGGGAKSGSTLTRSGVAVANGIFSVSLDFGSGFPGAGRFLEIRVRQTGGGGFTTLSPRQRVTSSPYSIKSLTAESATVATNAITANNATTANNAQQLGGVAANQFVVTTDPRMTNERTPTAGSVNYVQNTNTTQSATNFNISGNGTLGGTLAANVVRADTFFSIGGGRILSRPGTNNMFVGSSAGENNTTGVGNSFFGSNAGQVNTTGNANSFFGSFAGILSTGSGNSFFGNASGTFNSTGSDNAFFGTAAGENNTVADGNSFFGYHSGQGTSSGASNSFFGYLSGSRNTTGNENAFFGSDAGSRNTTGQNNTFIGQNAGVETTTGNNNAFVGKGAGTNNVTGTNNTLIGYNAEVGAGNLTFATAIGADADVNASNTIALGRNTGADRVLVWGVLDVNILGSAGSQAICRNGNGEISTCSSSLRYKTNINRFSPGLSLINQLKPITFDWKDGGTHDLGLGAEDVAAIEPLLVTYNKDGQVEGVKYDRIGVVLVNAVKEQQKMIEDQRVEIDDLRTINFGMMAALCELKPSLKICGKP